MDIEKAMPEVEVELNGQRQKIVFSLFAFCELERLTGINALEGATWNSMNATVLSTLLWAGLITHAPELKLEELRKSISLATLMQLYTVIVESMARASSEKKEAAAQEMTAPSA